LILRNGPCLLRGRAASSQLGRRKASSRTPPCVPVLAESSDATLVDYPLKLALNFPKPASPRQLIRQYYDCTSHCSRTWHVLSACWLQPALDGRQPWNQ